MIYIFLLLVLFLDEFVFFPSFLLLKIAIFTKILMFWAFFFSTLFPKYLFYYKKFSSHRNIFLKILFFFCISFCRILQLSVEILIFCFISCYVSFSFFVTIFGELLRVFDKYWFLYQNIWISIFGETTIFSVLRLSLFLFKAWIFNHFFRFCQNSNILACKKYIFVDFFKLKYRCLHIRN